MMEMSSWENCVAWKQMINDTVLPYSRKGKKIVLTHNGLYYEDAEEAKQESNQITEDSWDKIRRCAEDVMLSYEKCPPYSKKATNSYGGKHVIEEKENYYTTNGEFILAVFCSGVVSNTPQDWLNLSRGATGNMKKMNLNIVFPMRLNKVGH
jgi:hypothetical protein